jgi:integrase
MSSLYKDKNTWHYSRGSGKSRIRKSLQTSSKKEAKRRQKILDEHYWNAKGIVTVKLSQLIKEYKETVKLLKDSRANKRHVDNFYEWLKYDPNVDELKPSVFDDYKNYLLMDLENTSKTARNKLMVLSAMMNYALHTKEYTERNPLKGIRMPSKNATKPRRPIPVDDIKKAIAITNNEKDKIFWSLLLYTGLRVYDAGCLTENQVKQGVIQQKSGIPKPIPLPQKILAYGDKIYNIYPNSNHIARSRKRYQEIMSTFGYETDFHAIRHSVTTKLAKEGISESDIKNITGHDSKAVKTYIHMDTDDYSRIIDKI